MPNCAKFRVMMLMLLVAVCFSCTSAASTAVKVMTYNVFEGTDFSPIIAVLTNPSANANDFQNAVQLTVGEVVSSNPPLRMGLIAQEISNANPDLVGLQEAALWSVPGQNFDLVTMIVNDLALLGKSYTAVVTVPEFQIDLTAQFGVSFTDQDVILARTDLVPAITVNHGHYNHIFQVPASQFLPALNITRGWAYADVLLNGTAYRFASTHLEDGTNKTSPLFALVQAQQEIELISGPASTKLPLIIAGDFNTVANNPFNLTFLLIHAGQWVH